MKKVFIIFTLFLINFFYSQRENIPTTPNIPSIPDVPLYSPGIPQNESLTPETGVPQQKVYTPDYKNKAYDEYIKKLQQEALQDLKDREKQRVVKKSTLQSIADGTYPVVENKTKELSRPVKEQQEDNIQIANDLVNNESNNNIFFDTEMLNFPSVIAAIIAGFGLFFLYKKLRITSL